MYLEEIKCRILCLQNKASRGNCYIVVPFIISVTTAPVSHGRPAPARAVLRDMIKGTQLCVTEMTWQITLTVVI